MIDMLLVSLFMHAKKVVAIVKIVCDCGDADVVVKLAEMVMEKMLVVLFVCFARQERN